MPDKVFRDPLYNYIGIDRDRDAWLLRLLDTPEVQRLRRIHQLGVSNFTYPGAEHNRLAHTLGVVHLMQSVLRHLEREHPDQEVQSARQPLLAAALLHDVGHGPFSHLFEPCLALDHEEWSVAIILNESTQVNQILREQGVYLAKHAADLIEKDNFEHPAWQKALLSSELDVDRLDYIRRDSLFTGAGYGHFDWHRILTTFHLDEDDKAPVWPKKAAMAIEEYIYARFYMYQNVYLHKTTRGFEALVKAMWRRADELRQDGQDVSAVPALERVWAVEKPSPETLSIRDYLAVEEFTVLAQMHRWCEHTDPILSDLAQRFLCRDGFAMIEPTPPPPTLVPDYTEWETAVCKCLKHHGYDNPAWYCLKDEVKAKYRMPYRPEKEPDQQTPTNSIFVENDFSKRVEISTVMPRLRPISEVEVPRPRYFVPREPSVRSDIEKLAKEWTWPGGALKAEASRDHIGVATIPLD
ncbi:MAG: HD domain-containing protein [Planctomycetota bacterium]